MSTLTYRPIDRGRAGGRDVEDDASLWVGEATNQTIMEDIVL